VDYSDYLVAFLLILGWLWTISLALGFRRLRRHLREYEEERWGENSRK